MDYTRHRHPRIGFEVSKFPRNAIERLNSINCAKGLNAFSVAKKLIFSTGNITPLIKIPYWRAMLTNLDTSFVTTFKIESKSPTPTKNINAGSKIIGRNTACQVNELSPSTTINNTKTERTAVSNINCENPEKIEATRGNAVFIVSTFRVATT